MVQTCTRKRHVAKFTYKVELLVSP